MATLRIYDLRNGTLAVNLRQLLDLLAPRSLESEWIVAPIRSDGRDQFEATGPGGEALEKLAETASQISGATLLALATNSPQIVWGEFVATFPGKIAPGTTAAKTDGPWLTLRAIDSTFYEIETFDAAALAKVSSAFNDVRAA